MPDSRWDKWYEQIDAGGLPPAPRELHRASAFAGVHRVRLWDTGVIRNVGIAAAVVGVDRPQEETMNRRRAHFPASASVTDRSENVWHSALDASHAPAQRKLPGLAGSMKAYTVQAHIS